MYVCMYTYIYIYIYTYPMSRRLTLSIVRKTGRSSPAAVLCHILTESRSLLRTCSNSDNNNNDNNNNNTTTSYY